MKRAFTILLLAGGLLAATDAVADPSNEREALRPVKPESIGLVGIEQADPSDPAPLVDPELSPAPSRPSESFEPVPNEPERRAFVPGIVLLGIGSVGIGIGIAGIVVSSHKGSLAKHDAGTILKGGGTCQPVTGSFGSLCRQVADESESHNTWQKVGRGGLVVGIASAAAGILYLLWPEGHVRPKKVGTLRVDFVPTMGLTEGGAGLVGDF